MQRCPIDGTPLSSVDSPDLLVCERFHTATPKSLAAKQPRWFCPGLLLAMPQPAVEERDLPSLIREVQPCCQRSLLGRITIGFSLLVVGGCLLGALAQRLERADRAAEARIEVRCGR